LPPAAGFAAGVVYAVVLAFFIDRAGRRGDGAGATALGITAVVVAYPFLGEATARLRLVAWAFTLGALGLGVLLHAATGQPLLFSWLLLGLGAGTLLLAYGRGWRWKRWLVALPIVYLGLFTCRSLVLGKGVRAFYIVQSLAVLAIGYGGAVKLALAMGRGAVPLGVAALAAAVAYYTVAFTIVHQRHGRGRAFFWFASLALVYLALGVLGSGLGAAAWHAFLAGADQPWPSRIPRFGAALLALLGLGWAAVSGLILATGGLPPQGDDPAVVAVVRTGVLAATAITLALAARRPLWNELGWPVVPLLALGCVKLLIEDMRRGTPLTLTIAFALFGTALIMAPRLLLAARKSNSDKSSSNKSSSDKSSSDKSSSESARPESGEVMS
jgi:hypothetical protein